MNPWYAKMIVLLASIAMIAIRAPHGHRSSIVPVAKSRKGRLEIFLLAFAWTTFFITLVWIATPVFAFADYPLHPVPFAIGTLFLALGLWLLYRSHADLGTNWSITLEVRQQHTLVTNGVYRMVRHPMYLALLNFAAGEALVVPNWFVGPAYAVAMVLLVALRVGPEEQMMLDEFGDSYRAYMATTKRLIPGVW
jgi:protein-S-isoprenylcysteine O-methyltransferase Ste14